MSSWFSNQRNLLPEDDSKYVWDTHLSIYLSHNFLNRMCPPGEFLHLSMPKKLLKLGPGRFAVTSLVGLACASWLKQFQWTWKNVPCAGCRWAEMHWWASCTPTRRLWFFFLFLHGSKLHVLRGDVCGTSSWKSSQLGNHDFMVKFIRQAVPRLTGQRPLVDNLPRPRHGLSRQELYVHLNPNKRGV